MFAVFEAKGFQFVGSPGMKLKIPRLDSDIGEKISFEKVLLVKNGDTKIGQPYIEGASIAAEVVEHGRYKKIIVFKFKKRNRYRRTKGHRQTYTEIKIKDIVLGGKVAAKKKSEKTELKTEKKAVAKKKSAKKPTISAGKKAKSTVKAKKSAAKTKKKTAKPAAKPKKEIKATGKTKKTKSKAKKSAAKTKKTTTGTKKKKK